MTLPSFALLYDYRCPFARSMHEHVLAAMGAGLELDVTFEPFTLSQGHVAPGHPDVWDDPAKHSALLALEASVAVRDALPDSFAQVHAALFDARHAHGISLSTAEQVNDVLISAGVDATKVFEIVATGEPRAVIAERWHHYHDELDVFGVPTFVLDDQDAIFVRLMSGPDEDDLASSVGVITRLLRLMGEESELNEFKHTRLTR